MRMQADACSDRHTDACADIDSYALADFNAHACADVHVRACFACAISCTLWARGHARTGMHDGACRPRHMPTRTHSHTIMGPHAYCHRAVHIRAGDRAGTAILVHIRTGTEADLRCD